MDVSNQSSCNGHSPNLYKCIDTLKHGNLYQDYPSSSLKLLSRLCNAPVGNSNPPVKAKLPLQIVVVGAGLGGLASAIALARRGHGVTVLEQASVLAEVGAGIQIPPNSYRLLHTWGIGKYFEGHVVEPESMVFRRWQNGEPIGCTRLIPDFRDSYDAPYYVVHRAHFHAALCKLAHEHGVEVITDRKVIKFYEDVPSVETATGYTYTADLILAADGVKSLARPVVLGTPDIPPERTGFAAYRAVVDTDLMRADPDTAWLLEKPGINIWIGKDCHVMTYPIAGGKTFNMVLSHVDWTDPSTWDSKTAVAEMRACFGDWDPRLLKVIHMVTSTIKWPLMNGARLSTWISKSGRLLIAGDAAHAMVPYMSQGAAMAVEDGAALAEALSLADSKKDLDTVLRLFQQVRHERSYGMQSASLINGKLWHFPDGPEQEARDRGMSAELRGEHFVQSTNQWSDPVTQHWAYGYDAEKAILDAWSRRCFE